MRLPSLSFDRDGAVIFVGMDTPELPWTEVLAARHAAEKDNKAYICPGSRVKTKFSYLIRRRGFPLSYALKIIIGWLLASPVNLLIKGYPTIISEV